MRKIVVEPLTAEAFRPYGEYIELYEAGDGEGFYPDLMQLPRAV